MSVSWDQAIYAFLNRLGLTQAAAGFEADMLVMNPTWEENNVPSAVADLLSSLGQAKSEDEVEMTSGTKKRPLDERKLDYVHLANDAPPRTPSTINKEISLFLARNRARNDASNRAEFVYTPAQKRQRLSGTGAGADTEPAPSCARADAKPLDRDVQMKYDIAKNDEGPLSRTVLARVQRDAGEMEKGKGKAKAVGDGLEGQGYGDETTWTAERHPGLDERLRNIETHMAVRYVPSPPRTLLARLKYLEEHLIRLEKEYPPWAALHFNQPNRGWPPPPRQTPIIVPPHLRDVPAKDAPPSSAPAEVSWPAGDRKPRNTGSSLHRAVLERMEIKQAIEDLTGRR
ncbi:putative molybdopterin synthase activity [Lyophyllum shimeji]|uniref:Molybdopterin synthase activity n=1 Tax=Lyophyllum shimeji TaxID=47721 RepID=A0A9P3PW83_LYOSH|nr:putative molybdopterin synthase activity [Lyophyllum shimeji]